ncbi:MAG: hypothetical protein HY859_17895 [Caulobacterales bacterium]|nr:hypothetical protein [Caulobacterales bacterium]
MFDPWAPANSVLREKVIEHVFLAELSRALLLKTRIPFEVLRSEFDANGYDLVVEAGGILRHIQLKAGRLGGKRANVDINAALSSKPGGCVVWMMVDEASLQLGPFYWFGGAPGEPLPPLGDKIGRHTKGDATGVKAFRPALRVIPKGRFTRLETIEQVAEKLFGAPVTDELERLRRHLADRGTEPLPTGPGHDWLAAVRGGQFSASPTDLDWERSAHFAHLIDGFVLAGEIGIDDPYAFADGALANARLSGRWRGSPARLWLALFMEHRRWRQSDADPGPDVVALLDRLVRALTSSLT